MDTSNFNEPFVPIPDDRWPELQKIFKEDWPRCINGYYVLEYQRRIKQNGFYYGFQVYCPYGVYTNGMVAIDKKGSSFEIIVLCPNDDTSRLEEALKMTKLIDWNHDVINLFTPDNVLRCFKNIDKFGKIQLKEVHNVHFYMLDKDKPLFTNVSLPPGFTFGPLSIDLVDVINSTWPHRFPGSDWYFRVLIQNDLGYGLFKNGELISWGFIKELGALGHVYTLEEHRRKGYGALTLKLISNNLLVKKIDVYAFIVDGNENAIAMYKKLGFQFIETVHTSFLSKRNVDDT